MNPETSPPPNFNVLARLYRWMEFATFGPWLGRCRCAFLGSLANRSSALVLGDGDGRFTARMLRANRAICIDAVDASPAMLQALTRRAGADAARVHTFCADARRWLPASPPYDLVVTHFFLDCLYTGDVQFLAEKLRTSLSPSALWIVSEFTIPSGWFGRIVARPLIWFLYRAFGLLTGLQVRTLPDHRTALLNAGFALQKQRSWLRGLLVSELWSANPADRT